MELLNGIKRDTQIQRYIDLSKFMDIIENNQLFFCRIDRFEDKLEGASTPINDFFANGTATALANLIKSIPNTEGISNKDKFNHDTDSIQRKYHTVFGEIELNSLINHNDVLKAQKSWLDVSCWRISDGDNESMAMWKIYGQSNQSLCISTTIGQLVDSLVIPAGVTLSAAKVNYIDHSKEYYKNNSCLDPFINKHVAYLFENEARLIAYSPTQNPMKNRNGDEYGRVIELSSTTFINNIIVCPEAPN